MLVTFTRYRKRLGFATCGFIAAALLSGVITTHAADFSAGVNAYHRDDYATALRIMRELADQGDAFAQRSLGVMYSKGKGVPQDYAARERHRTPTSVKNSLIASILFIPSAFIFSWVMNLLLGLLSIAGVRVAALPGAGFDWLLGKLGVEQRDDSTASKFNWGMYIFT